MAMPAKVSSWEWARKRKLALAYIIVVAVLLSLVLGFLIGVYLEPGGAGPGGVRRLIVDDNGAARPATKIAGVVVGMVLLIFTTCEVLVLIASWSAEKWAAPLLKGRPKGDADLLVNSSITDKYLEGRLRQQLREINSRADHHFAVFTDFYKWYYMSIGTFSFAALIAAIALFFISRDGWGTGDGALIAVFVVATAAAAFYRSFINVFRQAENIAENKQLYKNYLMLENALRSFCAIGEFQVDGKTTTVAGFIPYIDQKLGEFNNIAVGFDATKVQSYEGMFDALEKTKVKQTAAGQDEAGKEGKKEGQDGRGARNGQPDDVAACYARYTEQPVLYLVRDGDTLKTVSAQFSATPEAITDANPDVDFSKLAPGEMVRIPGGADGRPPDNPAGEDSGDGVRGEDDTDA
jgi:hypothetical protein